MYYLTHWASTLGNTLLESMDDTSRTVVPKFVACWNHLEMLKNTNMWFPFLECWSNCYEVGLDFGSSKNPQVIFSQFSSVQSLSCVWLFATPWIVKYQIIILWLVLSLDWLCPLRWAEEHNCCHSLQHHYCLCPLISHATPRIPLPAHKSCLGVVNRIRPGANHSDQVMFS